MPENTVYCKKICKAGNLIEISQDNKLSLK